jgi:hypothetical protein
MLEDKANPAHRLHVFVHNDPSFEVEAHGGKDPAQRRSGGHGKGNLASPDSNARANCRELGKAAIGPIGEVTPCEAQADSV